MTTLIGTSLPNNLIKQQLKNFEGVVYSHVRGDLKFINLSDSVDGHNRYIEYLNGDQVADPLITPLFGNPLSPYVSGAVQFEVWSLLSTFQPLLAHDFTVGANFPFIPAVFPAAFPRGGIQYHHAKIAIGAVISEIECPILFGANNCPHLLGLPPGNVICDLQINYANSAVLIRLRKF
jgi:hypothetical protein